MENISVFDLVVTVLLATATFWGGLRGVVSQISSIATWVLSGLAAARYGFVVGEVVAIPEPWRAPVSALIVFCATLLALSVATRFVKRAVSLAGLKEFDRQAGALFGFFKGCAICVVLTFFCVLGSDRTRDLVDKSKSGPYLASISLLLKGAFPESETMTRFETLVGTMEATQAKRSGAPTLNSEIADLETYLKDNVLSQEAADVVEDAENVAESTNGAVSSRWSRFLNDLRGARGTNGATPPDSEIEEPENGESRGVWDNWNVWRGRENDETSDGATNDGYYDEYEEDARNEKNDGGWNDYVEYDRYADGATSESAETSRDWSDLATFLTNLTGGSRLIEEANSAASASSERRTANYAAAAGEGLNDFLGLPSNANVRNAAPTFDYDAPRTTDGAILGRPNASPTPLIPPLPY